MLNNANATLDTIPEDIVAEEEELVGPNVNKEWRRGDARTHSTVTLPEEAGQQRGGKRMSGIRDMLRALKKGAAVDVTSPPTVVDAAEEHHRHHHHPHYQRPFQHRVLRW